MDKKNIPKNALNYLLPSTSEVSFKKDEDTDDNKKKYTSFEMVGYTGGIIENHWYWDNLAFDLKGAEFRDKTPIMWAHEKDIDAAMGWSTGPTITDKGIIFTQDDTTLLENSDVVDSFISYSQQGFPFQSSLAMLELKKVEYVAEGSSAEVNGRTLNGPGHIFREYVVKECSICMFGSDNRTKVAAFNDDGETIDISSVEFINKDTKNNISVEESIMDYKEFIEKHPDSAARFEQEITDKLKTEFAQKEDQFKADAEKLSAKADEWKTKFEEADSKIKEFEAEKTKEEAASIWKDKFAEANLPERLFVKVSKQVSADSFMAEAGFDKEAFSAAIDKELEDWSEFAEAPKKIQGAADGVTAPTGKQLDTTDFADVDALLDAIAPKGCLKPTA